MSADSSPIGALLEHAARGVSGELIGVSDGVEVHVYLQRGRLAWATDSVHPLAFTRRLVATAKIDVETFREVLDACRREKRPLGETLMAWEVATKDEIRGALRHQIDTALSLLRTSEPMQTIFLARPTQFADYDTELTFTVEELGLFAPRPSPSLAPIERPAASMPPDSGTLAAATAYLRGSIDGLAWVEEHTRPASRRPRAVPRGFRSRWRSARCWTAPSSWRCVRATGSSPGSP